MRQKLKLQREPFPSPRLTTLRQSMIALLQQAPLTAREISEQVGVAEREVYGHLRHIRHSLHRGALKLHVLPAECHACGFLFSKRERLKKPGRCPVCRGQSISQPLYLIE